MASFVFLISTDLSGQYTYQITPPPAIKNIDDAGRLTDSIACNDLANEVVLAHLNEGYFEASIDSIQYTENNCLIHLHIGPKYDKQGIRLGDIKPALLDELKINKNVLTDNFHPISSKRYLTKIVSHFNNTGYPFATLFLDSTSVQNNQVIGKWKLDLGQKLYFDTIGITGNARIHKRFLQQYLGIEPLSPFNLSLVEDIPSKMSELEFITVNAGPELSVFNSWVTLEMDLATKNTSRFDLIFGIIPSDDLEEQNLFFSFDINAKLQNKLGRGETFLFTFERLRPEHQQMFLAYKMLYPFQLPVGLDLSFDYFRRSLEFLEIENSFGILFPLPKRNTLSINALFDRNRLIEIDSTSILQSGSLPSALDVRTDAIGIGLDWNNTDYRFNPQRGWYVDAKANTGIRTILPNVQIQALSNENVDFETAYDSLDLQGIRIQALVEAAYFFSIGKRSSLMLRNRTGLNFVEGRVVTNELFRLGGNQNLRGFDEQAFFAQHYSHLTVSYRLILGQNSYFSIPFIDYGYFRDEGGHWNQTIGVGTGISFDTRAGLLNLSLAVGRLNEQSFDLGRPKVHVGFNSLF